MPIYEYACSDCGHQFEELVGEHVGVSAEQVRCPKCGEDGVERLISSYAPLHRRLTPNQKRRLEKRRSGDRSVRRAEFKRKREAARKGGRSG